MNEPADPSRLDTPGRATLFSALRLPAFRWYLAGRTAVGAATWAVRGGVGFHVFELTGSFASLAAVYLAVRVTDAVLTVPAGITADRYPRRQVMVWSQIAFAVAMLVQALNTGLALGGIALFLVLHLLAVGVASFTSISVVAVLPTLVGDPLLQQAIALQRVAFSIGMAIGISIFGVLAVYGSVPSFAASTVVALLAAFAFSRSIPRGAEADQMQEPAPSRDVARAVAGSALLQSLLVFVIATSALRIDPLALQVRGFLNGGFAPDHATLASLAVVGGVAAVVPLVLFARRPIRRAGRAALLAFALSCVAGMVPAFQTPLPIIAGAIFLAFFGEELRHVLSTSILLEATPDRLRGRLFASMSLAASIVGAGAAWLVDAGLSLLDETVAPVVLGALGLLGAFLVARAYPVLWRHESVARRAPVEAAGEPAVS